MKIGEVAERTALSIRSLRHYDELGLVSPSAHSPGGFRLYTEADVERLLLIRRMKPLGFSLDRMKDFCRALDARAARGGVEAGSGPEPRGGEAGGEGVAGGRGSDDDDEADISTMVRKIAELRILHEERSAVEAAAPVLVVSQFTLMGSTAKGRRPSWSRAARAEKAEPVVDEVAARLRDRGLEVSTGAFGAMMRVHSVNDGPFTVLVDTQGPG